MPGDKFTDRNGSHRNPLDDLLTDEELRAESRKAALRAESREATTPANAKRASVAQRVDRSVRPIRLAIGGASLLAIGMLIGEQTGRRRGEVVVSAPPIKRVSETPAEIAAPQSLIVAKLEPKNDAPAQPNQQPPALPKPNSPPPDDSAKRLTSDEVYKRARPAVVRVVLRNGRDRSVGHGTGFFVRDESTLVTNFHVIAGASAAEIELHDGSSRPVMGITGFDPTADVAVLRIGGVKKELQPLRLSVASPNVRDKVSVIGFPLDLGITNTNGEVTGLDGYRERTGRPWVQIDARINRGNSGSPVLTDDGSVIGVASFIDTRGEKLHFASSAASVVTQLARDVPVQSLSDLLGEQRKVLNAIRDTADDKSAEAAEIEFSKLPDWYEHLSDYWVLRGDLAARRTQLASAIAAFHKAQSFADEPSQIWARIGDTHQRLFQIFQTPDHHHDAVRAYQAGITADPNDDACWRGLGTVRQAARRWEDAAKAFRRSLELKPKQALVHGALGDVLLELKDLEGCRAEYKTALNLAPNDCGLNIGYGVALRRMRRYSDSLRVLGDSIKLADNNDLRLKAIEEMERTRSLISLFGEMRKAEEDAKR